jgi:15-cis-phytoene synthase
MTLQTYDWEAPLLSLAVGQKRPLTPPQHPMTNLQQHLDEAYQYCEQLTASHSKSFYLASRLLPLEKRRAIRALYAFCRTADDIVDAAEAGLPPDHTLQRLENWRQRSLNGRSPHEDPVALAWHDTCCTFHVPQLYAHQLIDGVARDLAQTRYQTFADLAAYSYGVASTVGLMSMHIVGFQNEAAIPYAIRLGVALQITNILRDVAEDWRRGRLYLPLDELHAFNLSEADIAAGRVTDDWRAFMQFQIERNRRLYTEAQPGIEMLSADGRIAIAAAADLYAAILNDIEAHDYDVFSRRAHVNRWGKARRIPALWWRNKVRPMWPTWQ